MSFVGENLPFMSGYVLVNPSTGEVTQTREDYEADQARITESLDRNAGRLDLPSTEEVLNGITSEDLWPQSADAYHHDISSE